MIVSDQVIKYNMVTPVDLLFENMKSEEENITWRFN